MAFNSEVVTYTSDSFASGYQIRCDFDISNLESSPWHPRKTLNILGFIKLLEEPEME